MIITRAPHRISFFGGGTDYPSYCLEHGGKVLGGAIDKYCYITCRELPPFFAHKHRIAYSRIETVSQVDEIVHPAVREIMRFMKIETGLEIHHDGDIPARAGMGSSSAFTVCLLKTLHALQGRMISPEELYRQAVHVEQRLLRENVGCQDQAFATFGGLNLFEFLQNGETVVRPVILPAARLAAFNGKLMLFFSGISRIASEVAREQIENTGANLSTLAAIKSLVDDAHRILTSESGDLDDFGRLLHETWQHKRRLSRRLTTDEIDAMYDAATRSGALGGKLLGAGGGGFMLFYVREEDQARVRSALGRYLHIPFAFDFNGAEVIVYRPVHHEGPRGR